MSQAEILPFRPDWVSLPRSAHFSVYNDDITAEPYLPAPLSYAGTQRRGIHELLDSRSSFSEHIREAPIGDFPHCGGNPSPLGRSHRSSISSRYSGGGNQLFLG